MHILSNRTCTKSGSLRGWNPRRMRVSGAGGPDSPSEEDVYLKGMAVCCEFHPTLGTEPQNILADGM
jgi:hypothetical protein